MGSLSQYGSLASLCYHFMRDWSTVGEHVEIAVYQPIVAALCEYLPTSGGDAQHKVLVPGAGLCRLAWEIAGCRPDFQVEANEFSPLFATVADVVINRAKQPCTLCPLAHLFSECFSLENQFFETETPTPLPLGSAPRGICLRMGDFVALYRKGGPGWQTFDAVVTCFFLDTCKDIVEYLQVISALLRPGGVWVNLGPLNYIPKCRMKLCWDEVAAMAEALGLHWEKKTTVNTAYSLQTGVKMYTETYNTVFAIARKSS